MKDHIPVNSCETGKKCSSCSSCSPCMKKMMFLISLIIVLIGGYYVYTHFFTSQRNTYESSQSLSENSQYTNYSKNTYNDLLGKKPFALFFHASWCSTCRAEEKLIQKNLSSFPKDFTILKVNYDKETTLKKKYGITMQSIVVVLDKTGKEIGRVGDFSSIDKLTDLLSQR